MIHVHITNHQIELDNDQYIYLYIKCNYSLPLSFGLCSLTLFLSLLFEILSFYRHSRPQFTPWHCPHIVTLFCIISIDHFYCFIHSSNYFAFTSLPLTLCFCFCSQRYNQSQEQRQSGDGIIPPSLLSIFRIGNCL